MPAALTDKTETFQISLLEISLKFTLPGARGRALHGQAPRQLECRLLCYLAQLFVWPKFLLQ